MESNSKKICLSVLSDQLSFIRKCMLINLNTTSHAGKHTVENLTPNLKTISLTRFFSPFLAYFKNATLSLNTNNSAII